MTNAIAPASDEAMIIVLVKYLRLSSCAPQTVDAVRSDLPRWVRRLRERGVNRVPPHPLIARSPEDHWVHTEIDLLIRQKAGRRPGEQERPDRHLRNMLEVRPYKG